MCNHRIARSICPQIASERSAASVLADCAHRSTPARLEGTVEIELQREADNRCSKDTQIGHLPRDLWSTCVVSLEVGRPFWKWTKHDNGRELMDTVRQRSRARSKARHKENYAHGMGESNLNQIVTWAYSKLRETNGREG
jgi:hypothetical protein